MNIYGQVIISFLTTLSTAVIGILVYWTRSDLIKRFEAKKEVSSNKRTAFIKLLDRHAEIVQNKHLRDNDFTSKLFDMTKELVVWGSDEILAEYSHYLTKKFQLKKVQEHELHFAKVVLAYRKELGFKNKNIQPESIVLIFRSGYNNDI